MQRIEVDDLPKVRINLSYSDLLSFSSLRKSSKIHLGNLKF
jgi:hypothetical protein